MSDKMTREEAIDVLKHNYPSACFTDLCEAVEIAIQALSARPERKKGELHQWISCSERLPEPDEEVFVYLWDNVPYIASVNGEGQWDTEYFCVGVEDAPKAWMSLPKPYKGGTE